MSWLFPKTLLVETCSQTPDATTKVMGNPSYAAGVSVSCDLQRTNTDAMFRDYGVDLKNPARLYISLADVDLFTSMSRVVDGSDVYWVKSEPIIRDDTGPLVHAVILLEGLQYA